MAEDISFENLSYEAALIKAKGENKKLFVDVFTVACVPCKKLESTIFNQIELIKQLDSNFIAIRIDADKSVNREFLWSLDIGAFPTVLIIDPIDGRRIRLKGLQPLENYLEGLNEICCPEKTDWYRLEQGYVRNSTNAEILSDLLKQREKFELPVQDLAKDFILANGASAMSPAELHILFKSHLESGATVDSVLLQLNSNQFSDKELALQFLDRQAQFAVKKAMTNRNPQEINDFIELNLRAYRNLLGNDITVEVIRKRIERQIDMATEMLPFYSVLL